MGHMIRERLFTALLYFLIALILCVAKSARAEVATDKVAHIGASYALTTIIYGVFKHKMTRPEALFIGATTAFALGLTKEMLDFTEGRRFDTGDMIANGVGITGACVFVLGFEF